jgi:hypothetical protein
MFAEYGLYKKFGSSAAKVGVVGEAAQSFLTLVLEYPGFVVLLGTIRSARESQSLPAFGAGGSRQDDKPGTPQNHSQRLPETVWGIHGAQGFQPP